MKIKEELKELRSKSVKEILSVLNKHYDELRKLRFKAKMLELKDVKLISKKKKMIARILTVLREKLSEDKDNFKKGTKDEKKTNR